MTEFNVRLGAFEMEVSDAIFERLPSKDGDWVFELEDADGGEDAAIKALSGAFKSELESELRPLIEEDACVADYKPVIDKLTYFKNDNFASLVRSVNRSEQLKKRAEELSGYNPKHNFSKVPFFTRTEVEFDPENWNAMGGIYGLLDIPGALLYLESDVENALVYLGGVERLQLAQRRGETFAYHKDRVCDKSLIPALDRLSQNLEVIRNFFKNEGEKNPQLECEEGGSGGECPDADEMDVPLFLTRVESLSYDDISKLREVEQGIKGIPDNHGKVTVSSAE